MNTVEPQPQGLFPWVIPLWHEHRNDTPLVKIRCGAQTARGKCRGEVGRVWTTARGLLVELRQDRPGREMPVSPSAASKPEKFSVMRADGTGHSKRTLIPPAVIMLEWGLKEMLVACAKHGDLKYDADGLQAVCRIASQDCSAQRKGPRSAWLQPIPDKC
jgi:hypothetical protein